MMGNKPSRDSWEERSWVRKHKQKVANWSRPGKTAQQGKVLVANAKPDASSLISGTHIGEEGK